MADPTNVPNWIEWLVALIVGVGGKLGFDKIQRRNQQSLDDEIDLDKPFTKGQSVAVWLNDRVHKVKNDLDPIFLGIHKEIATNRSLIDSLTIKGTYQEREVDEIKTKFEAAVADIHRHIEASNSRQMEQINGQFNRIWSKLDNIKG